MNIFCSDFLASLCARIRPVRALLAGMILLAGCSSTQPVTPGQAQGKIVCDSYLVLDMCVRDLQGDGSVDLIYFSDTNEIFMYQDGMKHEVGQVMPFHRCAVPLDTGMQATTDRILHRQDMSLGEELSIARELIANYVAAKPEIDACNARYERNDTASREEAEFLSDDADWDEEW